MKFPSLIIAACAISTAWTVTAQAGPREDILAGYTAQAQAADAGFSGFDAARGKVLFESQHTGGKPDTPACTSCHDANPTKAGQTRAGKVIAPMAVSVESQRYMDLEKVEKWFRRNCNSVLGRECTPVEKGDFVTFMSQS